MANLTAAQQALLEAARQRRREQEDERESVPTQRVRTAAQGLTFGGADEAEAWARSKLTGQSYEDALGEVREKLADYRGARPWEALGYEAGGAALPVLLSTIFSGGSASPFVGGPTLARMSKVFPSLSRLATSPRLLSTLTRATVSGAAGGGAYAFGTGEGGFGERMAGVPGGAAIGAVASPAMTGLGLAATGPFNALMDAARRRFGGRGSSAVEAELQRIATEGGFTADEAAEKVLSGQIVVDNATVREIARGYNATGGTAAATLINVLPERAAQTRKQAMTEMQDYLVGGTDPNVLRQVQQADDAAKLAEDAEYRPFRDPSDPLSVADPSIISRTQDALTRVPKSGAEVTEALRARTGQAPFFTVDDVTGDVNFTRTPTVGEAESVRRAVGNRSTALYRGSMGDAGEAVEGVEASLRQALDLFAPLLKDVRQNAATRRANRDAFKAGRMALNRSSDEVEIAFANLAGFPEAIASYRAGVMDAFRKRRETGSRAGLMGRLSDPEAKENIILRAIFPEENLDNILQTIDNAAQAQATSNRVLGQSPTAMTEGHARRIGRGISAGDLSGVLSLDPASIARVGRKLIGDMSPELTDAQRQQIVDVLVSTNPEIVRSAFRDDSGYAVLQRGVRSLSEIITEGARRATQVPAGREGGNFTRGLLAQ